MISTHKMYMESYFPPPVTASPTYPAWSPDGKRVAFTSVRAGNYEISVMAVTGQEDPFNVSGHPERDDFVTWHPRGQRLLWVAERGGRHNLVEWKLSAGP